MASSNKKAARVRGILYKHSCSIKKTSEAKTDDSEKTYGQPPQHFVVLGKHFARLSVCNFDALQREWYPPRKGKNCPCSVDAVHLGDDGLWYAIEFKIGSVDRMNLVRKIHETIMGFKENLRDVASAFGTYEFYRSHLVYIVVASALDSFNSSERTFYRTYLAYREPWELDRYPLRWELKPLENVIVKRVYELSPSMFARFAKKKNWYLVR